MKKVVLLVVGLATLAGTAHAEDVKAKLQPIYDKFSKLSQKKDIAGLEKLWGEMGGKGFVYNVHGRTQNAQQMFEQMKAQMAMVKTVKRMSQKLGAVKVKGNKADVTVNSAWEMVINGPDGKPHTIAGTEQTLDTWAKTGNAWKLVYMKSISSKQTMDGKPLGG